MNTVNPVPGSFLRVLQTDASLCALYLKDSDFSSVRFVLVSRKFQPGVETAQVFVVSLPWTRPKRNDCHASHVPSPVRASPLQALLPQSKASS